MRVRFLPRLVPSALLRQHASPRLFAALTAVVVLGLAIVACSGGSDDPAFKPGPLVCDGLGKKSYHYTVSAAEEVTKLQATPVPPATDIPGAARPIKITWDIQGAVQGGDSVGSIDAKQHNETQGAKGDLETIFLEAGDSFYNISGGGWQQSSTAVRPPPLAFQPLNICTALSPEADTTKLGEGVSETVNGVASRKFSFQDLPSLFVAREPDFGGGSDAAAYIKTVSGSVWVAEKGNLITKLDITGTGQYENGQSISVTVKFEVTDLGGDIKVAAPV